MSDTVQQIKDKLSIADVVAPYVKLTKAGKYHKGLCPFHKEKTPSFMVSPERGFYHCFGCGKGGDIFSFIEEMERVDFKGALKMLAEKAGVPLVYEKGGDKGARERLYAILEEAKEFFVAQLGARADAKAYLAERGLKSETVAQWSLGYAPNEWRSLADHLHEKGFTDDELVRAGLAKTKEGTLHRYDTFRGRIMFPIRDASGRAIAFTGRIFEDDEKNPQAKYLNSPETEVFEKSRVLYGIDIAKGGIRTYGCSILVEGQIDLLMVHQAGYVNAVALSGTAFTEAHATLLARYSPNLVIAFDGDRAGIAAAGRAAAIALKEGMDVKIAAMPPGEDPADLTRRDSKLWKEAVKGAQHIIDFELAYLKDSGYDPRRLALEATRVVLPYLTLVGNEVDRAHFVRKVADAINVPEEAVRAELGKLKAPPMSSEAEALSVHRVSIEDLLAALNGETEDRAAIIEADLFLERYPEGVEREAALHELREARKRGAAREQYRETLAHLRAAERKGEEASARSFMEELAVIAKEL